MAYTAITEGFPRVAIDENANGFDGVELYGANGAPLNPFAKRDALMLMSV